MRFRWRRKAKTTSVESDDENLQALMLIHLGRAISAQQNGDLLRAIRQLSLAAEAIMALIEEWSGGKIQPQEREDEQR